nr:unnamed protein product [Digitaria exilis]
MAGVGRNSSQSTRTKLQFSPPNRPGPDDGTPTHGSPILIILMGRSLAAASSQRPLFLAAASLRSTPNSFTPFPSSPPRSACSWSTTARCCCFASPAARTTSSSCMSCPRSSCRTSRNRERKPRSSSHCRRAWASSVASVRLSFLSCSFSLLRSARGGDDADEELRSLAPDVVVADAGGAGGSGGGNAAFTTLPPDLLEDCGVVVDLRRRIPDRRPCSPRRKNSFANSHRSGTTFRKPCMNGIEK